MVLETISLEWKKCRWQKSHRPISHYKLSSILLVGCVTKIRLSRKKKKKTFCHDNNKYFRNNSIYKKTLEMTFRIKLWIWIKLWKCHWKFHKVFINYDCLRILICDINTCYKTFHKIQKYNWYCKIKNKILFNHNKMAGILVRI